MSRTGVAVRCLVLALVVALAIPFQLVALRAFPRLAARLPILFHRVICTLFHIRVRSIGSPPARGVPTLVLSNHVSWLDIPVLGSLAPLSFIAKHEIAGWPLVGLLARLQRCIFIERDRKAATAEVNDLVGRRMAAGDTIVLFPEGTTGDGVRLLPFRSSLVGAARTALTHPDVGGISVQPLAIAYVRRAGLPVTRREMPAIAWYGDMEIKPHLGGFVRGGPIDAVVIWGEPIGFDRTTDRKRTTLAAETAVRDALRSVPRDAILLSRPAS